MRIWIITLSVILFAFTNANAKDDCDGSLNKVESEICKSPYLTAAEKLRDRQIEYAKKAVGYEPNDALFIERLNACNDSECMKQVYVDDIKLNDKTIRANEISKAIDELNSTTTKWKFYAGIDSLTKEIHPKVSTDIPTNYGGLLLTLSCKENSQLSFAYRFKEYDYHTSAPNEIKGRIAINEKVYPVEFLKRHDGFFDNYGMIVVDKSSGLFLDINGINANEFSGDDKIKSGVELNYSVTGVYKIGLEFSHRYERSVTFISPASPAIQKLIEQCPVKRGQLLAMILELAADEEAARRLNEELERRQLEAKRRAEEQRKEKEARKAEERRKAKEARQAEEKRCQQDKKCREAKEAAERLRRQKIAEREARYGAKVAAAVIPNIIFTGRLTQNPAAVVEVKALPNGEITSRRLVRSSGVRAWDNAVLRAIDRTRALPLDENGRVPSSLQISFRPND